MNNKKYVIKFGGSIPILMITLIILKAFGFLGWSWFWVFAIPILLPFLVFGLIFLILFFFVALFTFFENRHS